MPQQVVSIKVGAALTPAFSDAFARAGKAVDGLTKKVNALDIAFGGAWKSAGDFISKLNKQTQTINAVESRLSAMTQAMRTHGSVQGQVATGVGRMAQRWEAAAKSRNAWNKAMSFMPPALPQSALHPPVLPGPVPNRAARGAAGARGSRGGRPSVMDSASSVVGGLGLAYLTTAAYQGVKGGVLNSAAFDAELLGVLNTAEVEASKLGEVRNALLAMTARQRTNQTASNLLGGLGVFAAAGTLAFPDQLAATQISGRVATAARASTEDISKTSVTLLQNLKVPITQLGDVLGMLTVAGKEGSFELRDMAQYFPTVGSMAANLGMVGKEGVASLAAAMQMVRTSAGTSAEASTYMENLLQKITANETLQRLQSAGVDWGSQVKAIMDSGGKRNMLEEFVDMMAKVTKNDPRILSALMPDRQAQIALQAMMSKRQRYADVKQSVEKGTSANTDVDFNKNVQTTEASLRSLANSADRVGKAIGRAFEPLLPTLARIGDGVASFLEQLSNNSPGAIQAAFGLAAGIGAVASGIMLLSTGGLAGTIGKIGASLRPLLASLSLTYVTGGLSGVLTMLAPVGVALAGIAAAALLIRKYWEPLKAFFSGFAEGVLSELAPLGQAFGDFFDAVAPIIESLVEVIGALLEPLGLTSEEFDNIKAKGKSTGQVVGAAIHLILKPLELLLRGLTKVSDWMTQQGGEDMRGKKSAKDQRTVSEYERVRNRLIKDGVWDSNFGRDDVDMGRLTEMAIRGRISAADLQVIAKAQNMDGVARGDTLSDEYVRSVMLLADATARREARGGGGEVAVTQNNNTTIAVNGAGSPQSTADAVAAKQREIAASHASGARNELRGLYQDHNSPQSAH